MIKENTEPKDEQSTIIPSTSSINHTVQQLSTINTTQSAISNECKQISLQGLNITPQDSKFKITPQSFHSKTQRVNFLSFYIQEKK